MADRFDSPYSLVDGDLFRTDSKGNRKRLCHKGGGIALAYDVEDGVLHHHGEYNDVSKWFDETRAKLSKSPSTIGLAAALALVSMPLEEECVQEVNRCIAVTGSVMGIEKRLSSPYGFGPSDGGAFSSFGSNHESV
jgi:hypothetical protein